MEITTLKGFIAYYEQTRLTTNRVIAAIPPEKLDWTYAPGKFTFADLIRHLAAIERQVFMEVIQGRGPAYKGCGPELADGYDAVMNYFHETSRYTLDILQSMNDSELHVEVPTLNGKITTKGNFLRALMLHEIHHRGAMCIYLNLLGIPSPSILGLTEQQVISMSN